MAREVVRVKWYGLGVIIMTICTLVGVMFVAVAVAHTHLAVSVVYIAAAWAVFWIASQVLVDMIRVSRYGRLSG